MGDKSMDYLSLMTRFSHVSKVLAGYTTGEVESSHFGSEITGPILISTLEIGVNRFLHPDMSSIV